MKMKRIRVLVGIWALAALLCAAPPARAGDLCLQYNGVGCPLSGDLGFFRLMGAKFPKTITKATEIHGRACGTGTVTGTMVMARLDNIIILGANFVCDATVGGIYAGFNPASLAVGSTALNAYASYGDVNLGSGCDVTIVDCATEP